MNEINLVTDRMLQVHNTYMNIAKEIASLSRATRRKVGCVIVDTKGRLVSSGYNGTPTGCDNECEAGGVTKHEVIHAEINAVLNSTQADLSGCVVYQTLSPCIKCAAVLLQKNVAVVYYDEVYRDLGGVHFLRQHGISCIAIDTLSTRYEKSSRTATPRITKEDIKLTIEEVVEINEFVESKLESNIKETFKPENVLETENKKEAVDSIKEALNTPIHSVESLGLPYYGKSLIGYTTDASYDVEMFDVILDSGVVLYVDFKSALVISLTVKIPTADDYTTIKSGADWKLEPWDKFQWKSVLEGIRSGEFSTEITANQIKILNEVANRIAYSFDW